MDEILIKEGHLTTLARIILLILAVSCLIGICKILATTWRRTLANKSHDK